jgi:BirA family biotin operon repressor/biotin-[acetyl-CoA-carboxylase] ligase
MNPNTAFVSKIKKYLPKAFHNIKIVFLDEIGSTQIYAKQLAETDAAETCLVIAKTQSNGYGRLGRNWKSQNGGIWCSVVLHPQIAPDKAAQMTLLLSLVVCQILEKLYKIKPAIKWPNDIMVNGKKLCGIITEMSSKNDKIIYLICGLGLNANNDIFGDLKKTAVSLKNICGNIVDNAQLTAAIFENFMKGCEIFYEKGFGSFTKDYNERCMVLGQKINVNFSGKTIRGLAVKIDENGYILIKTDDGFIEKILAGDVNLY